MLILKTINLSSPWPRYRDTPLSPILEKGKVSDPSSSPRGTVFYSLLACGLVFSGQTSSFLFDHPLMLSCTSPPQRVPSLPYLAVLALCCQLFQFGSGVSSYAHFCYHSGKMSSHKFGTDGASLLGVEGGKNIPRITKLGIKTSSTMKPIILFWNGSWHHWCSLSVKKTNEKYSCFLESNKLPEQKSFRYQYCHLLEISSLKSNIKSSSLIYKREQVIWNLLLSDMEIFDIPYLE